MPRKLRLILLASLTDGSRQHGAGQAIRTRPSDCWTSTSQDRGTSRLEGTLWKSRKLNFHPFVLLQTNLNRSSGHLGTMRLEFSLVHKPLSLYRKVLEAAQNLSDIFMQSKFAPLGPAFPTLD